jgi:hypothetical protein
MSEQMLQPEQAPAAVENFNQEEKGVFKEILKKHGFKAVGMVAALFAAGCSPEGQEKFGRGLLELRDQLGEQIAESNADARAQGYIRSTQEQSYHHDFHAEAGVGANGPYIAAQDTSYFSQYRNFQNRKFNNPKNR